jgi:hypothetical protein
MDSDEANPGGDTTVKKERRRFIDRVLEAGPITNWFSIAAAILGVAVSIIAFFTGSFFQQEVSLQTRLTIAFKEIEVALAEQKANVSRISLQLKGLQSHLGSITSVPTENALNIGIQKLQTSVDDVSSRETKLEAVIMQIPANALDTPLLRRDLDNLKDTQQVALSSLKDSVDRIYDLNKWLLGAMAISIVTLAVGNLLKPKEVKP